MTSSKSSCALEHHHHLSFIVLFHFSFQFNYNFLHNVVSLIRVLYVSPPLFYLWFYVSQAVEFQVMSYLKPNTDV